MKNSVVIWALVFLWSLFMGITVGSIGIGAVVPSMNLIAKPFVCPHGQMELETQDYHPSPVETVTTLTWYCVDTSTGERTELGLFPMSLYAGTIYGLILFAIIYVSMKFAGKRFIPSEQAPSQKFQRQAELPGDTVKRMKELRDLRDANLISESEYEQKRTEILKKL
ncbi:MAG: SHOCT domain-containing protein [Anaerolineales bacterium]|nr:SHOCT domain-containing protein [Anaerolineales bacterium]